MRSCGTYLFGDDAIERSGELCRELGLKGKAILVNEQVTWEIAGERISEVLKKNGFEEVCNVMVEKGAVVSEVDNVRKMVRSLGPSVVLGIGGGVNMDIAKAASSGEGIGCISADYLCY